MSKLFGNKNTFGMEYEFENIDGSTGTSWGTLKCWVKNKNICEYWYDGELLEYQWDLYYVLDWLCDSLEFLISYDPYPLDVPGDNLLDFLKNAEKIEKVKWDNDDEFGEGEEQFSKK